MNEIENKIRISVQRLNEEANAKWDNDRHIEINYYKAGELDLSLGKFERIYYTIRVGREGWKIIAKSGNSKVKESILADFITYVVLPIITE